MGEMCVRSEMCVRGKMCERGEICERKKCVRRKMCGRGEGVFGPRFVIKRVTLTNILCKQMRGVLLYTPIFKH